MPESPTASAPDDAYGALIARLDRFIRKYYLNQVIRGSLYALAAVGLGFLTINLLEANFYFDRAGRKALFYGYLGLGALALAYWVALPLARYFRLGRVISHDRAAAIIGDHFGDVRDKLLNLLQLGRTAHAGGAAAPGASLLLAGIRQKSEELRPVPFRRAIDLRQNRRYLRYALPPLLLLLALLVIAPGYITDPTHRLLHNSEDFERPAPFSFVLPEGDLEVVQFGDFPLAVRAEGPVQPAEAFVTIGDEHYRMRPEGQGRFSYTFRGVAADVAFALTSGGVASREHTLAVIWTPNLLGFDVALDYPAHTGRRDETLDNLGDLTVPEGTRLRWTFEAEQTDAVELRFGAGRTDTAGREGREVFLHERRAMRSTPYTVITGNARLPRADSVRYGITVVPDRHPAIRAETFRDSSQRDVVFFAGEASDDYGLSGLRFVYTRRLGEDPGATETVDLERAGAKSAPFTYTLDVAALDLDPGEEVSYYFEALDNDGVNGAKSARTPVESLRKKTLEEYAEARAEQSDDIRERLRETAEESREIQEEMRELRERLLQEREVDWRAKRELEKLMERQRALEEEVEEAKRQYDEQLEEQAEFDEPDEELLEKQEALQEMFEELQDPEMAELLARIQEMMERLEKDEALEMMSEMQANDEAMEQKLDRLEELFKELEVEYAAQQAAEELERLAEEQEELAEQTADTPDGREAAEQEAAQEKLNEAFEKLTEQLADLEEKNEGLSRPKDTGADEAKQEEVKRDQRQAGEQMQQRQNRQAAQKQQSAAQKMREMAQQMESAMQGAQQQQMAEDIRALRQLLENLVAISFDQEDLLGAFAKTSVNTPRYVEEVQRQFKLQDDFRMVEDSLQALAKRVVQIESFVLEKVADVKVQLERGLDDLEERQVAEAANRQQRVMTDVNDLALMLSESMDQMQQAMAQAMPGQQSCEQPGGQSQGQGSGESGGEQPSDKMSQGQQSLKEQLERAMENMQRMAEGRRRGREQGQGERGESGEPKPGEGAQGGEGGQAGENGEPSSREFAEMAARQAALRKELQDRQRELRERGKGSAELQAIIDEMNRVETDLVNKRLTNQLLERQQDLLTRLLEAEKAERQQDEDERRESTAARELERAMPPALEEYLRERAAQTDLYREVSPELKPYYRQLVERYFEELKAGEGR